MKKVKRIFVSVKTADRCALDFIGDKEATVLDYSGYVPEFFPEEHNGDYIFLDIDIKTGQILNWPKDAEEQANKFVEEHHE